MAPSRLPAGKFVAASRSAAAAESEPLVSDPPAAVASRTTSHGPQEISPNAAPADTRSADTRPADSARAALAASPVGELRSLSVERQGESLMISGRVQCFYYKQLAQETVRPYADQLRVINQVAVDG